MRKTILTLLAACAISLAGYSQTPVGPVLNTNTSPPTLEGPLIDLMGQLATATNWLVAPYATYAEAEHKYGGGIAAVYNITPAVGTMFRVDMLDGDFSMVSANLQLQLPVTIAGKLQVTTFGFSGIATPLGGAGSDNGTVQGVFGAGMDFKIPSLSKHWSAAFSIEKWTAVPGYEYRFTPFVWRF